MSSNSSEKSLQKAAYQCLLLTNVQNKVNDSLQLRQSWCDKKIQFDTSFRPQQSCLVGFPDKPKFVPFNQLPRRTLTSELGHAALIHSFAHIEFNAINIAWDAVQRFTDMPLDFYDDWSLVAAEEAYHFSLLQDYLITLGFDYGSFDAHGGLWEMVEQTKDDVLIRMALVPRVLEARGLDVTPGMIQRFRKHKKNEAADILDIIYKDEIGHVAIGSKWYNFLCDERGVDREVTFAKLIKQYAAEKIRKPFNLTGREQAGFSKAELAYLDSIS